MKKNLKRSIAKSKKQLKKKEVESFEVRVQKIIESTDVQEELREEEGEEKEVSGELKITCMKFIPKQINKPENMFFLRGGIFVDLSSSNEYSRVSNINFHTQIRSCSIVRGYEVVYTEFQTGGSAFDQHEQAILTLSKHVDIEKNQLAEALKKHEIKMFQDALVKQQVQKLMKTNYFVEQDVNIKEIEFQDFRESVIKSLPRDKIFHFVDFGFDSNGMSMKVLGEGFNDKYCNLMGCDIDTFQDISLRKGILEFKQANMRIKLLHKTIELFLEGRSQQGLSGDVGIITLDDILIDCQFNADVYISPSYSTLTPFFHPQYTNSLFDRGFAVIELILTDFHIQKINAIRAKYQNESTILTNSYDNLLLPKQIPLIEKDKQTNQNTFNNKSKQILKSQQQFYNLPSDQSNDLSCQEESNQMVMFAEYNLYSEQLFQQNQVDHNNESQISDEQIPIEKQQSFPCSSINSFEQQTPTKSPILLATKTCNSSVSNLTTDIPYQIQSQFFIDRFYGQFSNSSRHSHGSSSPRCGYKYLQKEHQQQLSSSSSSLPL